MDDPQDTPETWMGGFAAPPQDANPKEWMGGFAAPPEKPDQVQGEGNLRLKRQAIHDVVSDELNKLPTTNATGRVGIDRNQLVPFSERDIRPRLKKDLPWMGDDEREAIQKDFAAQIPNVQRVGRLKSAIEDMRSYMAPGTEGIHQEAERWGLERTPYFGMGVPAIDAIKAYQSGKAFQGGTATEEDYNTLAANIVRAEHEQGKSWGEKTFDLGTRLPAFLLEWNMLSGPGEAARAAASKAAANYIEGAFKTGAQKLLAQSALEEGAQIPKALELSLGEKAATKFTGALTEGLTRTALRPDTLVAQTLQNSAPTPVSDGKGGYEVNPGMPLGQAAYKSFRQSAIENIVFSAGGFGEEKAGNTFLAKYGKGLASGVISAEGTKELQYWGDAAPEGSSVHKFAVAKTPEERQAALGELLSQVAAFGGIEAIESARGHAQELVKDQKKKGLKPDPNDIYRQIAESQAPNWSRQDAAREQAQTQAVPPAVPPEAAKTPEVAPDTRTASEGAERYERVPGTNEWRHVPEETPAVSEQTPEQGKPVDPQRVPPPEPTSGPPAPEPGTGLINPVQTGVPGIVSGAVELPEKPVPPKSKGKKTPPPEPVLPPLKPGAPAAYPHYTPPEEPKPAPGKMTHEELFDRLREGKPVPGLTPKQANDLYQHHVLGKTLEQIGMERGLKQSSARESVRQSVEKALQALHGIAEEPPAPTIKDKASEQATKKTPEYGELQSNKWKRTDRYETALDALDKQLEEERRNAPNGELAPERLAWYVTEQTALSDEQGTGKGKGPAIRRAIARDKAAETARSEAAKPTGEPAAGRGGESSAAEPKVEGAPSSGTAEPPGHGAGSTGEPGTGGEPAGQPRPRGGLKKGTRESAYNYENRRQTESRKLTLADRVRQEGGIKPSSLKDMGKEELASLRKEFPTWMFSEKKGQPIDTLADMLEGAGWMPKTPEGIQGDEYLINLLRQHHAIDSGTGAIEASEEAKYHARQEALAEGSQGDAHEVGGAGKPEEVAEGVAFHHDPSMRVGLHEGLPGLPEGMGASGGQGASPPPPSGTPGASPAPVPPPVPPSPAGSWFRQARAFIESFAQKSFPALTRLSPKSGELLAQASNGANAAKSSWEFFSNQIKVGGKRLAELTPKQRQDVGATWLERRFRTYREYLDGEFRAAQARGDTNAALEARLARDEVVTLVGQPGSPLTSEQDYQDKLHGLWSFFEAVKQEWTPEVEKNYRGLKDLGPNDAINAHSQIPALPLNAIAVAPEDIGKPGFVGVGARQSLGNIRLRQPGFTRQAELNAPAYDIDVGHMMQRTLNLGIPTARRAEFLRQALQDGVIVATKDGARPPEGFKPLELSPTHGLGGFDANAHYYANPDAYRDIVQGLGIGERPGQVVGSITKPVFDKIASIAIVSPVELATHVANHITALFREGMGIPIWNVKDTVKNIVDLYRKDPEILRKVKDLAAMSASFGHEARSGLLGEKLQRYDPTAYLNKFTSGFIDVMQKAVRVQLGDAFDRVAATGKFPKTETAKRDFINQALGNYNTQSGNFITQFLKDTGLQPFATAAHTFTVQGIKSVWGGAVNAPTTSWAAESKVRTNAMLKMIPFLAIGPVMNYLRWGQAFPQNVPAFAIKTREDDDGTVHNFDPLSFTGQRRGARATGVNALVEGAAQGKSKDEMIEQGKRDLIHSAEHLVAGPPVQFVHTAATGENAMGHKVVKKGESETWAAVKGVNPLVSAFTEADRPKKPRTFAENLIQSAGPFGTKKREKSKGMK